MNVKNEKALPLHDENEQKEEKVRVPSKKLEQIFAQYNVKSYEAPWTKDNNGMHSDLSACRLRGFIPHEPKKLRNRKKAMPITKSLF